MDRSSRTLRSRDHDLTDPSEGVKLVSHSPLGSILTYHPPHQAVTDKRLDPILATPACPAAVLLIKNLLGLGADLVKRENDREPGPGCHVNGTSIDMQAG